METTKLIEEYLDGTLNDSGRKQFEERLSYDVEFNRLYELHKEVNESIEDTKFHKFHSLVQQTDIAYFKAQHKSLSAEHPSTSIFRYKSMMRYAAILLAVLGTAAVLKYTLFYQAKPEKLYDQYYAAYHSDMVMRSTHPDGTILENAILDYNSGDYAAAIQKLDGLTSKDQEDYLAWFYKGLTCLALDQTSEAINSFRVISPGWDHPLVEHRNWYLGLALLHNNNREEAVKVFSGIREFNGYYAESAGRILRKLGS